jgi:long-chain acyl-CoA synthetase
MNHQGDAMERIWRSYPPGVPADIDINQQRSLVELFDASVKQFGARPAFHNMGKRITFAELEALLRALGARLQAKGQANGPRVADMMPQ